VKKYDEGKASKHIHELKVRPFVLHCRSVGLHIARRKATPCPSRAPLSSSLTRVRTRRVTFYCAILILPPQLTSSTKSR
jgi:hypothetical protein